MFRMRVTIIDSSNRVHEYNDVDRFELLSVDKMSAIGDVTYAKVHQYYKDPTNGKPMHYIRSVYRPILSVNFEYVEAQCPG